MKDSTKKKMGKLAPNGPPFIPPEVIPDQLKVPKETILLVPDSPTFVNPPHFVKAGQHRDWFDSYFYHCLPLVMGNQHGFLMLTTYDFVCRWDGTSSIDGVSIHILEPLLDPNYITLESHFGFGILTVQSRYVYRTPPGVNLMVKDPPNYPIHGFSWMNAVVETDNLRRDFTFNIKITQPHLDIYVPRGTPIGCLLPYPRYFLDGYNMSELKDAEELGKSQRTVNYFSKERDDFDSSPRHRYMEGVDIYNIEFKHHQKQLDHGKWWFSKRKKHIPVHFTEQSVQYADRSLLAGISNIFKKFVLLASNAMVGEEVGNGDDNQFTLGQDGDDTTNALNGKKLSAMGKGESSNSSQMTDIEKPMTSQDEKTSSQANAGKCPVQHGGESTTGEKMKSEAGSAACPVPHGGESVEIDKPATSPAKGKCPVMHGGRPASDVPASASHEETPTSRASLKPENYPEIMELNADLPESSITLYLPKDYDKTFAPVKAERLRAWFEQDDKTKDHARFCLPLTMGSGIGYFLLSPATFTVTWDGDNTHDAQVEIIDGCSHAEIDCHSAHGSFTIQSQIVPRTKRPGDFVFIKGISNQYRLPYYFLEAMLEAWWSPANFGLVAMLNQAGTFTIKKGEPVAQMFAINVDQASYPLVLRDGYPAHWKEWDDKRRDPTYTGKNLDYLKGLWPDMTPVSPHYKSWSFVGSQDDKESAVTTPQDSETLPSQSPSHSVSQSSPTDAAHKTGATPAQVTTAELVQKARAALNRGTIVDAGNLLNAAVAKAKKEHHVSTELISTMHSLGSFYVQKGDLHRAIAILHETLRLFEQASHIDPFLAAGILSDLGYAERLEHLLQDAEEHFGAALEELMNTTDEVAIARGKFNLGSLYDQMGRHEDAEPLILEALEVWKRRLGDKHTDTLFAINGLACLYTHVRKFAEAEEIFNKVIADRIEVLGPDSLHVADSYNDLGFLYQATNDLQKAEDAFKRATAIRQERMGEDSLGVAEFLNNLAFTYREHKQFAQAKDHFEKVLAIKQKRLPANHPDLNRSMEDLAFAYRDLGEEAKANELFQKIRK
jgi:tetratricopeptide (TPR) repeat protein